MASPDDFGRWVWELSAEFWAWWFCTSFIVAGCGVAFGWTTDGWSARCARWAGTGAAAGALVFLAGAMVTVGTPSLQTFALGVSGCIYTGILVGDAWWTLKTQSR